MTPRERLMVTRLVTRLVEQPDLPKDPDAELELSVLLKNRADAPYLLLQRCLMLEVALEQAQTQVEQLRPVPVGSMQRDLSPSSSTTATAAATSGVPPLAAQPQQGGFLRNAATIGAGVLGGSLLFQGIESLLHGGGRSFLGGAGPAPVEVFETTNNFVEPAPDSREASASGLDASSDGRFADAADLDTGDGGWL